MALLEGAVLPKGSLILVTGVNGYVASHVADQFLRLGYKVRGTVRDVKKSSWVNKYFQEKYGTEVFELAEVQDLADPDAVKAALQGCSGLAAVASVVTFSPDPNLVIAPSVDLVKAALEAAAATPSVRRFVLTSSSSAAHGFGVADKKFDVPPDGYNLDAVREALAPPPYEAARAVSVYIASKVRQEQEVSRFVTERRPHFVANTVLPDFVCGAVLSVEDQGYPSSLGILKAIWDGDMAKADMLPPQWEIDAADNGLLHVAAMLHPGAQGERIFGFAYPKNNASTVRLLRELYPDRQFTDPSKREGESLANILARPRAEELLKWAKGSGFTTYKESLKNTLDHLQQN